MKTPYISIVFLIAFTFSIPFGACKEGARENVQEAGEAVQEEREEAMETVDETAKEVEDALVEGTEYHATGMVKCWVYRDAPVAECSFGVIRKGNGTADVHITKTDGGKRVIYFEIGKAVGYDTSEASSGAFNATQQGDTWVVFLGEERYEIPDAVIVGG